MRAAVLSLVNRNLVVVEEVLLLLVLERESGSRKRETHEREEDEETRNRVGRSGRGRGVRRPVGGRESKKKRNDEKDFGKIKR